MAVEYNHEKFKQAVLYICSKCNPHELGAVKLNKMLWLSDWLRYLHSEGKKVLTGATYIKQQHGHVPWEIFDAIPELQAEGKLRMETTLHLIYQRKLFTVLEKNLTFNLLSTEEKELMDGVITALKPMSAAEVSELSHRDEAWSSAQLNEKIPYETAWSFLDEEYAELPSLEARRWAEKRITHLKKIGQL